MPLFVRLLELVFVAEAAGVVSYAAWLFSHGGIYE
jgi:hypothetical protein